MNPDHPIATRPGALYFIIRAILRPTFAVLYRTKVEGRSNVPLDGPVLLASNHLSAWDTLFIPAVAPRPVQFLAKSQYFTASGIGGAIQRWFMTSVGAVPVARSGGHEAKGALVAGTRILNAGSAFVVFPEGSRSRDGRLYRGHSGAAWMAIETSADIVPVGLIGTHDLTAFGWLRNGGARPRVVFGSPIESTAYSALANGAARSRLTETIMNSIAALTEQERADVANPRSGD